MPSLADAGPRRSWWHLYGVLSDDGLWARVTIGECSLAPSDPEVTDTALDNISAERPQLHYLGSFDHEPSESELAPYTPDEYQTGQP